MQEDSNTNEQKGGFNPSPAATYVVDRFEDASLVVLEAEAMGRTLVQTQVSSGSVVTMTPPTTLRLRFGAQKEDTASSKTGSRSLIRQPLSSWLLLRRTAL